MWFVAFEGESARLRPAKGLTDIAELLRRPGTELHVLDLVTVTEGSSHEPRKAGADLGPVIDATARAAYEQRIRDLTEDLEEAEAANDLARAAHLDDERAKLLTHLAQALGLSGRARTAGSDAERARKAVGMRINDALNRLDQAAPALGRHLRHSIQTGTFCCYRPERLPFWQLA